MEINLSFNKLDDRCQEVLKNLASLPTLEKIDFSFNQIGKTGAAILNQYRSDSLETIYLRENPAVRKEETQITKKRHVVEDEEESTNKRPRLGSLGTK